jgi:hypothetical protein
VSDTRVDCSFVDIDLMAYRLVDRPQAFDVIAAPNLFGDILGDLAAVMLGARALSFGASYNRRGDGVYQTNHGAAYDIAGMGRANPVGQILSLAMMLRESLGLGLEAWALEEGVRRVWGEGGRTDDLGGALGVREMAERVARPQRSCSPPPANETASPARRFAAGITSPRPAWSRRPGPWSSASRPCSMCAGTRASPSYMWTTVSRSDDRRMPHWKREGRWLCEGTPGHEPPRSCGLERASGSFTRPPSARSGTGALDGVLREERADLLVVAGVHLHGAVRQAVLDAYQRHEIEIWVAADATAR